jgi:hypothetical protein
MKARKKIYLNLASRPLKNRRLFYFIFSLVVGAALIFSIYGGVVYIKYRFESKKINAAINRIENKKIDIQRMDDKFTDQIENVSLESQGEVDMINSIIYKKSFSWVEFLSIFEKTLPEACYLVSFDPVLKEGASVLVNFKVASPDLGRLLKLINTLNTLRFRNIRLVNESKAENGLFIYEMSLNYERTI